VINIVLVLAFIGLIVSLYGIFVERELQRNADYKAACDISDYVSCTRPFLSPYAKILGISNSYASAIYYVIIMTIAVFGHGCLLMMATGIGMIATLFFAYILYCKIKSFCLICNTLYVINIILFSICYFFCVK